MIKRFWVDYEALKSQYNKEMCGSQGFCLIKDDKVYKVYYDKRPLFVDLTNYKSSNIAFPIYYLGDKNNRDDSFVIGEIMPYFSKVNIEEAISKKTDLNCLKENIYRIIKEINNFKELKMNDLCYLNLLYDDSGFSIIDTTSWYCNGEDNSIFNVRKLESSLAAIIAFGLLDLYKGPTLDEQFCRNLLKYGDVGKQLKEVVLALANNDWHILMMIELYQELALRNGLEPLKTIGDIEICTKRIKKG